MFKKIVKKLAVAATLVGIAATVAATAACNIETKHPEVRITVEFNEVTYELDYTLYRNMYPNTVRHFIELAESGIYDNMLIHDYRTTDWLSGGYEYNAEEYRAVAESGADGASFVDYLVNHSLEGKYMELFANDKLTPTVYGNHTADNVINKDTVQPTLIGEFYNNIKQEIKKGALSAEIGTLKMYYYAKETPEHVYVTPTGDDKEYYSADYKTNCATSIFAMQVSGTSRIDADNYCVFGKMDDTSDLQSLIDAVKDYYTDNDDVTSITVQDVPVDNEESFSTKPEDRGIEVDFTLPALPIVIKTIKVTKY